MNDTRLVMAGNAPVGRLRKVATLGAWLQALMLVACGGGGSSDSNAAPPPGKVMLSVAAAGAGQVVVTPGGATCNGTCQMQFDIGSVVTLTEAAAPNYQFDSWAAGCAGITATCTLTLAQDMSATANFTPIVPVPGVPYIDFTDAVSGPTTGGENNLGSYLSIFGRNFGDPGALGKTTKVYIGGVEVGNYRYLGTARAGSKLGTQQIAVQVGNLAGLAQGQAAPIKVVVGALSSNTDKTFIPNPGGIFFVSLAGDDATAVIGDIGHPFRHLQTDSGGGVHAKLRAGDQVVIRGGNWSDLGMDGAWFRFRYPQQEGSPPTGQSNSGWIHFTAYPGPVNGNAMEDVHYTTPPNVKGGIQGANSAYYGTTGDYVVVSNLRMDVDAAAESDAAPVNLQYSGGPWRVINNELGPWPSRIEALAAGVSGHGQGSVIMGNYIHDIACTGGLENHGIYADSGAANWDIGYNWISHITGGNLIQFFDNIGLAGNSYSGFPPNWPGFTGMRVHHNWMEFGGKYGLNMADSIVSGQVWNNVITGVTYSGLRFNTASKNMDMTFAFNTFYDNDQLASGSGNAQVLNTWGNYNPTGTIRIYDNIYAAGPHTLKTSTYYANMGATDAYFDFKRNLWWDNGYKWGRFGRDALAVLGDPAFTAPVGGDLSLLAGSPGIDAGTQPTPMAVVDDITSNLARPMGAAPDLGAYEFSTP